jgi:hypothetical protein
MMAHSVSQAECAFHFFRRARAGIKNNKGAEAQRRRALTVTPCDDQWKAASRL